MKYIVQWSEEDQDWVGTCDQHPTLSWLASTSIGALSGIQMLVAEADIAEEAVQA